MRRRIAGMFFSLATIPFALISATTQETRVVSSPSIPPEVPDSLAGLQTQVDELVRAAKTRDQGNWQIALETFSLPNPGFWFQTNFAPEHLAQLTRDYTKAREGHFALMSSVIAHHQDALNFRIQVTPSQMPAPPSSKGPESQLPLPSHPLHVQNFLLTAVADSGLMPPSWVFSFVYADGHFRVVGDTYPFWAEDVHAARLLHKVSPDYPKKARKEHVEGLVRLHAIIGKDGSIRELEIISGHPLLADAALKAVRQWRYSPTLVNGEPVEVDTTIDVFFELNR